MGPFCTVCVLLGQGENSAVERPLSNHDTQLLHLLLSRLKKQQPSIAIADQNDTLALASGIIIPMQDIRSAPGLMVLMRSCELASHQPSSASH